MFSFSWFDLRVPEARIIPHTEGYYLLCLHAVQGTACEALVDAQLMYGA